ncbi:MAG: hypothetical protein QOE54_4346 [Streptosporangiaceae bacterium]|nr:hypothetical protein [Streptosporangiaceae bacterium]
MPTDNGHGPPKVVLGTNSHAAAGNIMSTLAEHTFPVRRLTMVSTGLKAQQVVGGRSRSGRGLIAGVVTGGWPLLVRLVLPALSLRAAGPVICSIVLASCSVPCGMRPRKARRVFIAARAGPAGRSSQPNALTPGAEETPRGKAQVHSNSRSRGPTTRP